METKSTAPLLGSKITFPDFLQPSWQRVVFAGAVAFGTFFLPQEVPLIWHPLNEPGDDILYLEIKCAADADGDVKIFKNNTRGINELDTINWPISASNTAFTYTFPLNDAPLIELRLSPPAHGVTLVIEKMRVIDRRETEIRRFTSDMFFPSDGIESIVQAENGWQITSTLDSPHPQCRIELYAPIIAKGISHRNTLRCLYSTSYLGMMLWILLLAICFSIWRPIGWRDFSTHVGFMACLAIMFSFVGNRGLIKNSWHYAQFEHPQLSDEIRLELDLISSAPTGAQLFWDSGSGYSEAESDIINLSTHNGLQTARFKLPKTPINSLRLDPRFNSGEISIRGIRIVDWGNRTHAILPLDSLQAGQHIESLGLVDGFLEIQTSASEDDPVTIFKPETVALINAAVNERLNRFNY